ncbi:MAG: helicase, partial [Betaproteobacteria bacterium]|nr:helicase [Betaproteobacteria bacterium]
MLIESLRDYQIKALEELRAGAKEGHRSQILVAPTGAGKTVSASYLLNEAREKKNVAWFICDRVSLVDQTSTTLDRYGVPHGVIQA